VTHSWLDCFGNTGSRVCLRKVRFVERDATKLWLEVTSARNTSKSTNTWVWRLCNMK